MGYFDKFDAQQTKLENILEEKFLLHKFRTDTYPMTLTITQNQTPDAQMALYDQGGEDVSSQDSRLVLTFPVGEVGVRIYGRLVISDTLLGKIKNCGKKMRDLYLQGDYARRMEMREQYGTEEGETPNGPGDFEEFMEPDDEDEDENEGAEE